MAKNPKSAADIAKKAQREADGRRAMAEYEAAAVATRAKTEKLKALRLARDAAESVGKDKQPTKRAAGKTGKKRAGQREVGTLAEYLGDREKSGHRS